MWVIQEPAKSLGFYLIKIVTAWYNKHTADEKDRGDVRNVPGPEAAEAERPWSQTWRGQTVCCLMQADADLLARFSETPDAPSIFWRANLCLL